MAKIKVQTLCTTSIECTNSPIVLLEHVILQCIIKTRFLLTFFFLSSPSAQKRFKHSHDVTARQPSGGMNDFSGEPVVGELWSGPCTLPLRGRGGNPQRRARESSHEKERCDEVHWCGVSLSPRARLHHTRQTRFYANVWGFDNLKKGDLSCSGARKSTQTLHFQHNLFIETVTKLYNP